MQPKWILRNKYKLMVFIVLLYVGVDIWQHKGQAMLLLPKNFPTHSIYAASPKINTGFINSDKHWKKAVNSKDILAGLNKEQSGFECDVYFHSDKNIFQVHHDWDKSTGLNLEDLLLQYQQKELSAGIWLDFKNLDDTNQNASLKQLILLRSKFNLQNKLLVESKRADLLNAFCDSGFFTSFYTPMFNPFKIDDADTNQWVDSLTSVLSHSKVNALSGYYFQYPLLKYYFPKYPVLIWSANDRFSLVNWMFQRKIAADKTVFIVLNP